MGYIKLDDIVGKKPNSLRLHPADLPMHSISILDGGAAAGHMIDIRGWVELFFVLSLFKPVPAPEKLRFRKQISADVNCRLLGPDRFEGKINWAADLVLVPERQKLIEMLLVMAGVVGERATQPCIHHLR